VTVSSTDSTKGYDGDGNKIVFPTPYFIAKSHINAIHRDTDGNENTWMESTHYTLTGAGNEMGGTLTVKTSPVNYTPKSGERLVIKRVVPFTQGSDYPLGGGFPSTTVEQDFDLAAMRAQQNAEAIGRSLHFGDTADLSGFDPTLPAPDPGAPILGVKSDGSGLEWILDTAGSAAAAAAAQSADAAAQSAVTAGNSASAAAGSVTAAAISAGEAQASAVAAQAATLRRWIFSVVNDNEELAAGPAKLTRRVPYALTVSDIYAYVITASSSGNVVVDVSEGGATIMATDKITIEANQTHSNGATTQPDVTDASLGDQAILTFDIVDAGTGAKGLVVVIEGVSS
jgi:hypothetical protein